MFFNKKTWSCYQIPVDSDHSEKMCVCTNAPQSWVPQLKVGVDKNATYANGLTLIEKGYSNLQFALCYLSETKLNEDLLKCIFR